jgi:hypothetical protein
MKVARLSALSTGRLYPQGDRRYFVPISVMSLSQPEGHSAARRIRPKKNSNNPIGNRARELNYLRDRVAQENIMH